VTHPTINNDDGHNHDGKNDGVNLDLSPLLATQYREALLSGLQQLGWSTSGAAETGLSTTVMLNDEMIGASVDMSELFTASGSVPGSVQSQTPPSLTVFAFSATTEKSIPHPPGTVIRRGLPAVTVARHQVLDLIGCEVVVPVSEDLADTTSRTIAALAASVEQFHAALI